MAEQKQNFFPSASHPHRTRSLMFSLNLLCFDSSLNSLLSAACHTIGFLFCVGVSLYTMKMCEETKWRIRYDKLVMAAVVAAAMLLRY